MEKKVGNIILVICVCISSYFTTIQLITYVKNEDITVMSYQEFHSDQEVEYPVFTVCYGRNIFKQKSEFWIPNVVTPKTYFKFLRGRLNFGMDLTDRLTNFYDIKFDDVTIDLFSDLVDRLPSNENTMGVHRLSTQKINFERNRYKECYNDHLQNCPKPPIVKSDQNLDEICYSRKFYPEKDVGLFFDQIILNASKIIDLKLTLKIFVHKKNQLIMQKSREAQNQIDRIYFKDLKELMNTQYHIPTYYKTYKIDNVIILKHRNNGKVKCEKGSLNEDNKFRDVVENMVGCVPAYWRFSSSTTTFKKTPGNCSQNQYAATKKLLSPLSIMNISKSYIGSCTQMTRSVFREERIVKSSIQQDYFKIQLKFEYSNEKYMNIENKKAFSAEMLLSSIGGYVGK